MEGFRMVKRLLCVTTLLLTSGCTSNEEGHALMKFFKDKKNFPSYSKTELASRWAAVVKKRKTILKGMGVEEVVGVLGFPDSELGTNVGPNWVLPEKCILQYSPGVAATPGDDKKIKVFHVYFDEHGKVLKTSINEGFITTASPR